MYLLLFCQYQSYLLIIRLNSIHENFLDLSRAKLEYNLCSMNGCHELNLTLFPANFDLSIRSINMACTVMGIFVSDKKLYINFRVPYLVTWNILIGSKNLSFPTILAISLKRSPSLAHKTLLTQLKCIFYVSMKLIRKLLPLALSSYFG